LSLMGNTAMPQPMSEPTRNGYNTVDAMATPMGAPLPGCRSGMAATWVMPSRAATWWHCATASDSIQLVGEANTETVAGPMACVNCGRRSCEECC
jgi:hypothetical protein